MIRTYLFFIIALYLAVSTNVFAQDKILIGKIAVSPKSEATVIEPILFQRLKEESVKNGFSVEIKSFASTEDGLKFAEREGFSFYSEIHSFTLSDLPPDIYILTFSPKDKYIIDSVSEELVPNMPEGVKLNPGEFQESKQDVIDSALKKYFISLKLNPEKKFQRDNVSTVLQSKDIRDYMKPWIKNESSQEKMEDSFANLQMQFETATRSSQKIEDIPVSVTVITKKEIRDYNYRTLVEALKFKPGIMVSEPGNGETGHHFYQRGLIGNAYSKILINGIPINPSASNGMPINEMLYLKHAESIEVVYGPASAIYGADAFAGVVNIKTSNKNENQMHMATHVGDFGYLNFNFFGTQKVKLAEDFLYMNVYGLKSQRKDQNIKNGYEGVYSSEQYYQRNGQFGGRINYFSELPSSNESYGVSAGFKKFSVHFDHMHRSENSSMGQQSSFYSYADSGAIWSENIDRLAMKNSADFGKLSFNTNVSYNKLRLDPNSNYKFRFEKQPLYKYMASDDFLFEQTAIYKPIKSLELLGGFSWQYSGVFPKTNDLKLPFNENFYSSYSTKLPPPDPEFGDFGNNPIRFRNTAGFLQSTATFDKTSFVVGIRSDYHTLYGQSINPRIAVNHKFTSNQSLRLSYTEGFRGAPAYLIYNSVATGTRADGIQYFAIPNKSLIPEKLRSYEIGLRSNFTKIFSTEAILFHNYIENKFNIISQPRDQILYPLSKQDNLKSFGNIGKSYLTGFELILNFQDFHKPTEASAYIYNTIAKGSEFLQKDSTSKLTRGEQALEEILFPNTNKINSYRSMPKRKTTFRISVKLWKVWFLALDYINSDGWYSSSILSSKQYRTAEYNPTFDPYKQNFYVRGFNVIDFNSHIDINKYFRILLKVTNLTNSIFSGKGAYADGNDLTIHPQYRRNVYLGCEFNHSW